MTGRLHAQAMVLATILAAPGPAEAQFKVCNQTKVLVNFAVGRLGATDYQTEGWWTVEPNSCSTPIREAMKARYVYLYAVNIDGKDLTSGTYSMCIERHKFQIEGVSDCWRRGFASAVFSEIDTLLQPDWTVVLNDKVK